MGWAIGGVAAVIDSMCVNTHFHNTLWLTLPYVARHGRRADDSRHGLSSPVVEDPKSGANGRSWAVGVGATVSADVTTAGVAGVPRRYATYPAEIAVGPMYAKVSLIFIVLLLLGALVYIWETGRRCLKAFSA